MNARVRVKLARWRAAFAAIGCTSTYAIARKCGLDPKSVYRVLDGEQVGEHFMARTVATLANPEHAPLLKEIGIEPTLDSLYEVTTEPAA